VTISTIFLNLIFSFLFQAQGKHMVTHFQDDEDEEEEEEENLRETR
jgi:hypothetical protein